MSFVKAVLGRESPVAVADVAPPAHDEVVVDELVGNVPFYGGNCSGAHVNPHEAEADLERVRTHLEPSADRRVGAVGQHGAQVAGLQVEGPAVVRAADRLGELTPAEREGNPAVWASVVKRMDLLAFADQDDVFAKDLDGRRLAADAIRPLHGIPVVAKAQYSALVHGPRRPVLTLVYGCLSLLRVVLPPRLRGCFSAVDAHDRELLPSLFRGWMWAVGWYGCP